MDRFVAIGEESSFGTAVSATHLIDIASHSINPTHNVIYVDTAGQRLVRQRVPGFFGVAGDIEFFPEPHYMGIILKGIFGNVSTEDLGSGLYKHTFTIGNSMPSFTLEVGYDLNSKCRQIVGCGFRSLRLEATARELLSATLSVVGKTETGEVDPTTGLSFSDEEPFVFYEGTLKLDGSEFGHAQAVRLTFTNDFPDDVAAIGSRFLQGLYPQRFEIEGELEVHVTDWSLYKKFISGGTGATPGTSISDVSLDLKFTKDDYFLEITLPHITYNEMDFGYSARDKLSPRLPFRAWGEGVTVILQNDMPEP